ncbi:unnamed protein product [Caenorhabditis brenneri]
MNTIPLHQLPDEVFKRVLRNMETYDQLAYSLCSENTKEAIKSLNLKAEAICIRVGQNIVFDFHLNRSIHFRSSIVHDNYFSNEEFKLPNCIEVSQKETGHFQPITKWKMESQNFGAKDWLRHFCEVLHNQSIYYLSFEENNQVNNDFIEPVQRIIEGLHIASFSLGEHLTPEFTKKALESFHYYETLYIEQVPFNNNEVHKMDKFLIQNLSEVSIAEAERLQINQVLLSNCEKLRLSRSLFTDKFLKVFLKLWICGSNPRLKHFSACRWGLAEWVPPFNEEVLFKGIRRTIIPSNCQEEYKDQIGEFAWKIMGLAGGSRIRRYDGTTAVVLIDDSGFDFIVGI